MIDERRYTATERAADKARITSLERKVEEMASRLRALEERLDTTPKDDPNIHAYSVEREISDRMRQRKGLGI